jgi:hypothetical protein
MAGTGSRTLKLSILGDIDNLKKNLTAGTTEVQGFGSKLTKFGKIAGAAFAAAGAAAAAYAGKLLVDGVKSAIEDEAAQAKLALTLKNVTGATDAQVAATESYIQKQQLLYGVTDADLRPSFERLTRATGDLKVAQEAQSLALDIAAGSGKSLEAVSNALGKAYEGNMGALGKLGVGLSAAELKTMSMDEVTKALAATFEGQAAAKADTFAGKMARLKEALNEGKETVGSYVLDALQPLVTLMVNNVIPAIQTLGSTIGENLKPYVDDIIAIFRDYLIPYFQMWWGFISDVVIPGIVGTFKPILEGLFEAFGSIADSIQNNSDKLEPFFNLMKNIGTFILKTLAPAIGTVLGAALKVIGVAIGALIGLFANLVSIINGVVSAIQAVISLVRNNPIVKGIGNVIDSVFGGGRATGGAVSAGTTYLVGERGPELFTPNMSGGITPNNKMTGGGGTTINLNVTGAIDPEGTARTIINALNASFYRGTGGATALVVA